MGKVNFIRSSRKQWKCDKCGSDINKGDSYYRGEVNFGPVFIRCNKCKLQSWEVTTSDWTRSIGEIVNTWQDNYSLDDEGVEELYSAIEDVQSDVQDRLDNMPEGLQEGDIGQLLQERIEMCESAMYDLENIDFDELKLNAVEEWYDPSANIDEVEDEDFEDEDDDESDWLPEYDSVIEHEEAGCDRLVEIYEGYISDAIEEALNYLEY